MTSRYVENRVIKGLGLPQGASLENHAAYVQSWLKHMKNDPAYIFNRKHPALDGGDSFCSY